MTTIGITQTRLDEIELRLLGADHRPWAVSGEHFDENGRPLIVKASKKAARKAEWASLAFDGDKKPDLDMKSRIANHTATTGAVLPLGAPTHVDARSYVRHLALFRLCDEASTDMGHFVAHAPQDIEDLLGEVKRLRARLRDAEQERDEFKKEMLSLRVEKSAVGDKLADVRKLLREFGKAVKDAGVP